MSKTIRQKLIASFFAAGISASSAFVAHDLTLPSESLQTKVHLDPIGLPTVCIGHMDRSLKIGQTFSIDECMRMFAEDWKKHEKQLEGVVKAPYSSEWQKAALTDFTFNVGIGNVKSSTLLKLVNQGKHADACYQLSRWTRAGGSVLKGLVTRRKNTIPYCLGEIPWSKQQAIKEWQKEWDEYAATQKLAKAFKEL